MRRTSMARSSSEPTGRTRRSSMTRSRRACIARGTVASSSRKMVPPEARTKAPSRFWAAPVNAPRTCPNSSLSSRVSGRAPQSMTTNGPARRGLPSWMARAASSLPVPVSPSSNTVTSELAESSSTAMTSRMARLSATRSPNRRDWLGATSMTSGRGCTRRKLLPTLSVAPAGTVAALTNEPSYRVPLRLPRSRTTNRPPSVRSVRWRRETRSSVSTRSQSSSVPTTQSSCPMLAARPMSGPSTTTSWQRAGLAVWTSASLWTVITDGGSVW